MPKTLLAGTALVLATASHAETTLSPLLVTALREPVTADRTLTAVSVIERADIEARQPRSVIDLLRTEPGLEVSRNGGRGQVASLFLRGTNADHTLVLVDGVRAASSTTGQFDFSQLDPAQIERIEIVRGPRSTLYGSDAIGGVVHIFTRQPEGVTARVGGGSHATKEARLGYGTGGDSRFSINGAWTDTEGISATNSDAAFGFDPDDDAYRSASATARFESRLWDADARLQATGWFSDGEVEFDQGVSDTRNQVYSLALDDVIRGAWSQQARVGYSRDRVETRSAFPSDIRSGRWTASWLHRLATGTGTYTLGADYYRDQGENDDPASGAELFDEVVTNRALFGHWRGSDGPWDLELGVRHDDHGEFGGHTTGNVALGRALGSGWRGWASWGRAFKAPSFNELFFPGFGNPQLEPETARSTELGLRYADGQLSAGVTAFRTRVDDLIDSVQVAPFVFEARNIDSARIRGLELELEARHGPWMSQAHVTLQDADEEGSGEPLPRRADLRAGLSLTRSLGDSLTLGAESLYVGERRDAGERLGRYVLVNLSARFALAEGLALEGRLENLLDQDYQLASGFNTPGLSAFGALTWRSR